VNNMPWAPIVCATIRQSTDEAVTPPRRQALAVRAARRGRATQRIAQCAGVRQRRRGWDT
jgi:hypothetical protein